MYALHYTDLMTLNMSQCYVIECCDWYIQFPVDPVSDMFTLVLFPPQARRGMSVAENHIGTP